MSETNLPTSIPRIPYDAIVDNSGAPLPEGAHRFGEALRTIGFVVLADPPFRADLLDENYQMAREVFELGPELLTEKYAYPEIGYQRGYMPTLIEHGFLCGGDPDEKEVMCFGSYHNVPLDEYPDYLPTAEAYYSACQRIGYSLIRALSLYLDPEEKERDYMLALFRNENGDPLDDSHMRHLKYPGEAELMACRHTDINMITLLPAATRSGLQVQRNDGAWLPLSPEKGDLIVNAGDMLNFMSGGRIKSTLHQVVNPDPDPNRPRFSMPFFYHPDHEQVVKVLDTCKDEPMEGRRFPYDAKLGYHLLYEVLHGIHQIPEEVTAEAFTRDMRTWRYEGLPKR